MFLFRSIGSTMITCININPDFLCVSVSAMDNSVLLSGRPYGGCSIIYRKSLGMCITPLISCSDRFCGVKLCDSLVYMPAQCSSTSTDEYLNTLGELEGFISTQQCDSLASQPYFFPCAHARMISGWGEGSVW